MSIRSRSAGFRRVSALITVVMAVLGACTAPPPASTPVVPSAEAPVTATSIPTPAPTATPAPSPTPNLAVIEAQARRARADGDTKRAAELFEQASTLTPPGAASGAEARYELARIRYETGELRPAIDTLIVLISDTRAISAAHPSLPIYLTLLGRAQEAAGETQVAAANYADALAAGSVISPYLNLWLGNYFLALNQPISAVAPYQASAQAAPSVSTEFERREKLALALQLSGQAPAAVAQYDDILLRARFPTYRARILWESAQALLAAGANPAAYARMQDLVSNYETAPQAHLALQALVAANQSVDELQRGRVNYHASSNIAARDAFRRAIVLNDGRADEVRLWAARNYIVLKAPTDALRNLDQIIAGGAAGSDKVVEALAMKAGILIEQNDLPGARALFKQAAPWMPAYPSTLPSSAKADAFERLGLAFERAGAADDALLAYGASYRVAEAKSALPMQTRVATLLLQLGRHEEAESALLAIIGSGAEASTAGGEPSSRLRFWLSKAQIAAGKTVTGEATLRALAQDLPDSYEGVRAAQLISRTTFSPAAQPFTAPAPDDGQPEAETWLRAWTTLSETVDVRTISAGLLSDARLQRGAALWQLGFDPEAIDEYSGLLNAYAGDPIALYQLALHFRDAGAYRLSIQAADALIRLSPAKLPSKAPRFIARLLYPVYFAELVGPIASEYGINPLLVFSVMRQESLFEAFALSSAAASGLMQVIPSTGAEINRELGWPANYSTADLNKPFVSVRFGTYYLAKQRRLFDSNLYAMLAAYNGGPGNALRWRERAGDDPDAFVEAVTFDETRRYIVAIAVNLAQYTRLYSGQ